jgi:hypothetical protein
LVHEVVPFLIKKRRGKDKKVEKQEFLREI